MDEMRQERGRCRKIRKKSGRKIGKKFPDRYTGPASPRRRRRQERRKTNPGRKRCPSGTVRSPQKETGAAEGGAFWTSGFPTLLYAVIYTFLLYDNWASVTMPIFVAATAVYVFYIMKNSGVEISKTHRMV